MDRKSLLKKLKELLHICLAVLCEAYSPPGLSDRLGLSYEPCSNPLSDRCTPTTHLAPALAISNSVVMAIASIRSPSL